MRHQLTPKRVALITLVLVAVIALGILYVTAGQSLKRLPQAKPVAITPPPRKTIANNSAPADSLQPAVNPLPSPQVAGAQTPATDHPTDQAVGSPLPIETDNKKTNDNSTLSDLTHGVKKLVDHLF